MRILYDSKDLRHKTPFGTLVTGEKCTVKIHIPVSCRTVKVTVCLERENGSEYAFFVLEKEAVENEYEIYQVSFSLPDPGLFFYYFSIQTVGESFRLFRYGFDQTNMEAGEKWQLSCIPRNFKSPDVFCGAGMYQIFPDRFHQKGKTDLTGKLQPYKIHENHSDTPDFLPNEAGEVLNCDFFGGNLAGIEEKLEYLESLGVEVIYLNPIFKAWSNHRYDTADYKKIDEMLGTEADFASLCQAAHRRGMKVILDGVFSHTGSHSVYFDEKGCFGNGAYHHEDSPYRSWFEFQEYPNVYTSWWGIKTLPCVREMDPGYLDFIIDSEDSVVVHWLRAGADGFRLDVADELPDEFILRLRKRLKEIKPDALLLGEVWEDASNKCSYGARRRYFTDGELDSVMNYPFRQAILDFVTEKDGGASFRETVLELAENYPPFVFLTLMNFLSTHDTPRILSALSSAQFPEEKSERAAFRLDTNRRNLAEERLFCASFLQFILPGMPCIYYGDELGLEGLEDPFCRGYFPWKKTENNEILEHYRALARLRKEYPSLKKGTVSVETDDRGFLLVERKTEEERTRAVINVGEERILSVQGEIVFSRGVRFENGRAVMKKYSFFAEKQ